MSESFIKFKRKVRAQSIVSAALIGVGAGAFAFSVIFAIFRLTGLQIEPLHYILCASGALILGCVLYLLFVPSDKRLARRLDILYSLDEKVSTMIELEGDDSMFSILQREDADERLSGMPIKQFKSKRLIAAVLVFVLSIFSVFGSLMVPAKAQTPETPISEFDKQWIIASVVELITTVENAYINDELKTSVLDSLGDLLAFVEESDLMSEMKAEAIRTVIAINSSIKSVNSAEAIADKLKDSTDKEVSALAKQLAELSGSGTKKALESLGSALSKAEKTDADFTASEIDSALQSSGVRADDELYLMFKKLTSSVREGGSSIKGQFDTEAKKVQNVIILQNVNRNTVNIVLNKLCSIFGITEDDITSVDPDADVELDSPSDREEYPDDSDDEDKDKDKEIGSGGLGTGDTVYGSDDLVYDPRTETYRPYGEILNEYFAKVSEMITDGKTSEQIADAAEEYFGILFSGSGKED